MCVRVPVVLLGICLVFEPCICADTDAQVTICFVGTFAVLLCCTACTQQNNRFTHAHDSWVFVVLQKNREHTRSRVHIGYPTKEPVHTRCVFKCRERVCSGSFVGDLLCFCVVSVCVHNTVAQQMGNKTTVNTHAHNKEAQQVPVVLFGICCAHCDAACVTGSFVGYLHNKCFKSVSVYAHSCFVGYLLCFCVSVCVHGWSHRSTVFAVQKNLCVCVFQNTQQNNRYTHAAHCVHRVCSGCFVWLFAVLTV